MEIKGLTNEQLIKQFETFQDRIETLQDYISDTEDEFTKSNMVSQLQRYQMTFYALREELSLRNSTVEMPSMKANESFVHQLLRPILTRKKTDEGWKFMRFQDATLNFEENDIHYRWTQVNQMQLNLEFNMVTLHGQIWKPIGFLHVNMGIIIMNEFIKDALQIIKENREDIKVTTLNTKENALVGAFSYEMTQACLQKKDTKINANGLNFDVLVNFEGNSQVFLSDKYKTELGAIAVYQFESDSLNISPVVDYKELFEDFLKVRFLTAFTIE